MRTNIRVFAFAVIVLLVIGCGQSSSKRFEQVSKPASLLKDSVAMVSGESQVYKSVDKNKSDGSNTISPSSGSSSAAVENLKDTLHKFIRTADIKFKVGNVEKSTYQIEDIVTGHGGFVTFTNLASNVNNTTKTQVSADSSVETTQFTVTNSITLRVPNTQLDTTLKDIAKLVGFLDYRVIKADDISLQLLGNDLLQKRTAQHAQRLAKDIDANPKKLETTMDAEANLLDKQAAIDEAKIANLSLAEQRQYSTVKLELYQPETIATVMVANPKPVAEYKVGFATRLLRSLQFGLNIMAEIFLAVLDCWVFILLGLAGYIGYRKYVRAAKTN